MKLTLSVISFAGADVKSSKKITLNQETASLGRTEDNALVLPDPNRYVSGHHALIEYRSPDYFIKDTSANGVLINNSKTPLGNGNSTKLDDGDLLTIGDYILEVKLEGDFFEADSQTIPPFSDTSFTAIDSDAIQGMIDKNDLIPSSERSFREQLIDPFDLPDSPIPKKIYPSESDYEHISPYAEALSCLSERTTELTDVKPASDIPADIFSEDWYLDKKDKPQPSETAATQAQIQTEIKPAKPENKQEELPAPQKSDTASAFEEELIQSFLRGAQLEQGKFRESIDPETFFYYRRNIEGSHSGNDGCVNRQSQNQKRNAFGCNYY